MAIGTESDSTDNNKFDALLHDLDDVENLDMQEIDGDSLRQMEFEQISSVLDELPGKTVKNATIEDTRIVLETTDGNRYFFFGYMGAGRKR